MPEFCVACNNLLLIITKPDEFYFKCQRCQITYQPTPDDTQRFDYVKGTDLMIYRTILQNAGQDPVNPKVMKNCISCNNDVVKQVRLGEDMRLINICTKCNKQWIEGLENK